MTALASEPPVDSPTSPLDTIGMLFRRTLNSEADILNLIERGVTGAVYHQIVERLALPKNAVGAESTIRNRLRTNARLNTNESERLVMIGRVYAAALTVFGTQEKAVAWLHKPARYLRDKPPMAPIEFATRDSGVRLLEEKLLRTMHGLF